MTAAVNRVLAFAGVLAMAAALVAFSASAAIAPAPASSRFT